MAKRNQSEFRDPRQSRHSSPGERRSYLGEWFRNRMAMKQRTLNPERPSTSLFLTLPGKLNDEFFPSTVGRVHGVRSKDWLDGERHVRSQSAMNHSEYSQKLDNVFSAPQLLEDFTELLQLVLNKARRQPNLEWISPGVEGNLRTIFDELARHRTGETSMHRHQPIEEQISAHLLQELMNRSLRMLETNKDFLTASTAIPVSRRRIMVLISSMRTRKAPLHRCTAPTPAEFLDFDGFVQSIRLLVREILSVCQELLPSLPADFSSVQPSDQSVSRRSLHKHKSLESMLHLLSRDNAGTNVKGSAGDNKAKGFLTFSPDIHEITSMPKQQSLTDLISAGPLSTTPGGEQESILWASGVSENILVVLVVAGSVSSLQKMHDFFEEEVFPKIRESCGKDGVCVESETILLDDYFNSHLDLNLSQSSCVTKRLSEVVEYVCKKQPFYSEVCLLHVTDESLFDYRLPTNVMQKDLNQFRQKLLKSDDAGDIVDLLDSLYIPDSRTMVLNRDLKEELEQLHHMINTYLRLMKRQVKFQQSHEEVSEFLCSSASLNLLKVIPQSQVLAARSFIVYVICEETEEEFAHETISLLSPFPPSSLFRFRFEKKWSRVKKAFSASLGKASSTWGSIHSLIQQGTITAEDFQKNELRDRIDHHLQTLMERRGGRKQCSCVDCVHMSAMIAVYNKWVKLKPFELEHPTQATTLKLISSYLALPAKRLPIRQPMLRKRKSLTEDYMNKRRAVEAGLSERIGEALAALATAVREGRKTWSFAEEEREHEIVFESTVAQNRLMKFSMSTRQMANNARKREWPTMALHERLAAVEATEEFVKLSQLVKQFDVSSLKQASSASLLLGRNEPLFIFGHGGSGRSTAIALALRAAGLLGQPHESGERGGEDSLSLTWRERVIVRCIGSSEEARSGTSLMLGLLQSKGLSDEHVQNVQRNCLQDCFPRLFAAFSSHKRLVLVLDGLERLSRSDAMQLLSHVPTALPNNVKLIVSCTPELRDLVHLSHLQKGSMTMISPPLERSFLHFQTSLLACYKISNQPKLSTQNLYKLFHHKLSVSVDFLHHFLSLLPQWNDQSQHLLLSHNVLFPWTVDERGNISLCEVSNLSSSLSMSVRLTTLAALSCCRFALPPGLLFEVVSDLLFRKSAFSMVELHTSQATAKLLFDESLLSLRNFIETASCDGASVYKISCPWVGPAVLRSKFYQEHGREICGCIADVCDKFKEHRTMRRICLIESFNCAVRMVDQSDLSDNCDELVRKVLSECHVRSKLKMNLFYDLNQDVDELLSLLKKNPRDAHGNSVKSLKMFYLLLNGNLSLIAKPYHDLFVPFILRELSKSASVVESCSATDGESGLLSTEFDELAQKQSFRCIFRAGLTTVVTCVHILHLQLATWWVFAHSNGAVSLWDGILMRKRFEWIADQSRIVFCRLFSSNSSLSLVTVSVKGDVGVWDLTQTAEEDASPAQIFHASSEDLWRRDGGEEEEGTSASSDVTRVSIAHPRQDEHLIALAFSTNRIVIQSFQTNPWMFGPSTDLGEQAGEVTSLVFSSPPHLLLVSSSLDGNIRAWAQEGESLFVLKMNLQFAFPVLSTCITERFMVFGGNGFTGKLDISSDVIASCKETIADVPTQHFDELKGIKVIQLALFPSSNLLVVFSDTRCYAYNGLDSLQSTSPITSKVLHTAFDLEHNLLFCATSSGSVDVWTAGNLKPSLLAETMTNDRVTNDFSPASAPSCVSISCDGEHAVCVCGEHLCLWSTSDRSMLRRYGRNEDLGTCHLASFCPSLRQSHPLKPIEHALVAIAWSSLQVTLNQTDASLQTLLLVCSLSSDIRVAAFSTRGDRILTGGLDNTGRVWAVERLVWSTLLACPDV
eukprot:767166-Hanusia_phi.AAC.2